MTKGNREVSSSKFYLNNKNDLLFINYQCKKKKSVSLISTMHNSSSVDQSNKKKPLVIHFYNKNKAGVYVVDQILRQYSTYTLPAAGGLLSFGHSGLELMDSLHKVLW